jgi:hypothetical protein
MDDDLISISEAARKIGLNKSTLIRQVKSEKIRSHNGKVRLSEVLEDRAANIEEAIGGGVKASLGAEPMHASVHASTDDAANGDIDDDAQIIVDGEAMPIGKAKALKETYLARLRKLEFETKSERLIDADTAKKMVFELSRADRDAWTNWPAQVSPLIAAELGVPLVALAVILEKYVRQHLSERGDPTLR